MKLHHNFVLALFCFSVTFSLMGCGDNKSPAKVTGTITLDGEPVQDATVTFIPESGERISQSMTDKSGRYELMFTAQLTGAVVGKHKVTIQTGSLERPSSDVKPTRETIPKKYNAESELIATLKSGKNVVNFELTTN